MALTFSIIIPVYNVEPYLKECLDSVLGQTCGDFEAVCVNDGSTDGSLSILEDYAARDSRIRIISQPNGGLSAARNTGIDAAQGDYILFLDSDDWLESNALQVLYDNLNGEDVICFGGRRYDEANGTYRHTDILTCTTYKNGMDYYNSNALVTRDFAFVCVVLRCYRRQYLIDNNLRFREGRLHEDNLFTPLACYYAKHLKQISNCLYNYRIRANSITTTNNSKRLRDLIVTANELASFFIQKTDFPRKIVFRAITHHYQVVFTNATKNEMKEIKSLCNWRLYYIVSNSKLRHRWNFLANMLK